MKKPPPERTYTVVLYAPHGVRGLLSWQAFQGPPSSPLPKNMRRGPIARVRDAISPYAVPGGVLQVRATSWKAAVQEARKLFLASEEGKDPRYDRMRRGLQANPPRSPEGGSP